MTKTNFVFRSGLPLLRRATAFLRWAARRLELRSFGLFPEQFNLAEGYRAAAAVAVPLILAVSTGNAKLGWAVFAAFWTCLCDAPGPDELRRRNLAIFVICGAFVALTGSWLALLAPAAGMAAGPFLVVLCVIGARRVAYSNDRFTVNLNSFGKAPDALHQAPLVPVTSRYLMARMSKLWTLATTPSSHPPATNSAARSFSSPAT